MEDFPVDLSRRAVAEKMRLRFVEQQFIVARLEKIRIFRALEELRRKQKEHAQAVLEIPQLEAELAALRARRKIKNKQKSEVKTTELTNNELENVPASDFSSPLPIHTDILR